MWWLQTRDTTGRCGVEGWQRLAERLCWRLGAREWYSWQLRKDLANCKCHDGEISGKGETSSADPRDGCCGTLMKYRPAWLGDGLNTHQQPTDIATQLRTHRTDGRQRRDPWCRDTGRPHQIPVPVFANGDRLACGPRLSHLQACQWLPPSRGLIPCPWCQPLLLSPFTRLTLPLQ